jgi:transposase
MLTLPPSVRIFAAIEPVDARKSFDGLAAVVRDSLGGDPMTGHMFFFLNRRGDMAQILLGADLAYNSELRPKRIAS